MYAEVNSREPYQQDHCAGDQPNHNSFATILYPGGDYRCEGAVKAEGCERVSAGKTVRLRRQQVEIRNWPRALKGQFESCIQKGRTDHGNSKQDRFALPVSQHEPDTNRGGS